MEQTTPYRRTGAAVLFFIATALTLLNTIILSVAYSASIISIADPTVLMPPAALIFTSGETF